MSASFFSKLRYSLFFFGITLCTGITQADDTEIYFTGAQTELTRPNVLLILDTSGSMDSVVTGTSQTRIEAMKEAMVEIIEGMEDVNVGLMRFTYKQGGPVLHEIRYIDDPLATGGSVSATITASDNDAEEDVGTGVVTVADPVLDIAQVGFSSPISIRVSDDFDDADERDGSVDADTNDNFRVGYSGRVDGARFTGIDIPPNGGGITTTITGATLTLWPSGSTPNDTDTDLSVEVVDNATAFADNFNNLSSRTISTDPPSNTHVDWDNIATTDPVSSPDISSLIQLIIDRPGWSAGNAINIFAENGSGTDRAFQSHDTNPSEAPLLTIAFTTTAATTTQLTGLRFEDIDIPQGATITSAVLNLTPSSSDTDSGTAEVWRITAENDASGNSAAFDSGIANDISARTDTTAFVDYNVPDTTINSPIQIPNLNAVIQEVIKDNGAWCGGNALTLFIADQSGDEARHIHSYDGSGTPPTLDITYDLASATGCYEATETAQIQTGVDDVEQDGSTMDRNSGDMDVAEKLVGLRFQDVDIPQGATILSASIQFKATGSTTSGNPKVDIVGELIGDAPAFTTNANNLSGRTPTAAEIEWTTGDWSDNEVSADTTTPDLTAIVQEIVNLPGASGWASGNSMVFRFDTSSNRRSADSYEGSANNAARLSVSYRGSGGTQVVTVRDNLVDIVNALPSNDYTPITEVFYEAAHYWRGESVEYGTGRDNRSDTRLSTSNTYTGGTIYNPPGCPADNLDDSDCSSRAINGNPVYTSPFSSTLTCQANYQVLMTDGEANENNADDEIRSEYLSNAACQSTKSDASAVTAGELCSIDLVEYMHENDQSTLDNDQLVTTYTVGFDTAGLANATQFLQDVAAAGGGDFFQADNKQGLIDTFNAILTDVKDDPTSFVAPSLATNSFNRLLSRDEAYFGLFTPSLDVRWPGNVKKYRVCIDSSDGCTLGEILDATGTAAVGSDNRFLDTAQSIWSDTGDDAGTVDGRETTLGGVGGDTVDFNTRIIYTETTASGTAPAAGTSLDGAGFKLTAANWDDTDLDPVRDLVCPDSTVITAGSECEEHMLWMLGSNTVDPDPLPLPGTDPSATTRWTVNDVLHSSPKVITYGGADTLDETVDPAVAGTDNVIDVFYDKIIFGTNEGGLRLVNGTTGEEEWTFMPQEVFVNQRVLLANGEAEHIYGLDTTPVLRIVDNDFDGVIEPADSDLVHVYQAMRRGGTNIYALDLTATIGSTAATLIPKFMWRIEGGTTDFNRLAQTWSPPSLATIATSGGPVEALIFGGGYDTALDSDFGTDATVGADNNGNAIYIVNADSGALIFSISGSGTGADIEVADMHYSIPSEVRVIDTDGDDIDDRLFVGDTGGQVWRVDLADNVGTGGNPEGDSVVGRLASIATQGTPVDERSFFEPPSYVQVLDTEFSDAAGGEYDYILMGTGNRSHPLNSDVADRFYGFRDLTIGPMTDSDNDNIAEDYPKPGPAPITHATANELTDVTTEVLDSTDADHRSSLGWFFDFDTSGSDGEKVLSGAVTLAGAVLFTTYSPDVVVSTACTANLGGGNAYNFNILSTAAFLDWDGSPGVDPLDDRKLVLGGGIPSDVVPIFTEEGVVGIVGIEGGAAQLGAITGLPRVRTYWYQENI